MPPAWTWLWRALFVAYVTVTAIHIGWVVAHEPFTFDAWNVAVATGAQPITIERFFDFWWLEYAHSNPRLGQVLTYLAYKLDHFAVVATPLAYLAISLAVVVLGTGRWPSWRRGRDLALWAFAIGGLWFALPQLGKTLFCRAYSANYVYGAAIQLWFLVPLRLASGRAHPAAIVGYALAGVVAGACNEHTGPALCLLLLVYAWRTRSGLGIAGAVGALAGFAAILFAPGQAERYDGLAQRAGVIGRVIGRGVTGNLDIFHQLVLASAPIAALIVVVLIVARDDGNERRVAIRRALAAVAVAIGVSLVVALTLLASPKLGPRFYYFGAALVLAGLIGLVDASLTRRAIVPLVALAIASSAYAAASTVPLYARVHRASEARLAALAASAPGSVFVADAFEQVAESWWFLGDDLRDARKRDLVARYFGLTGVVLRAFDPNAPLGVAGARLVPHYDVDPPGCLDERGGLAIGTTRGFDLPALHREIQIAIAMLTTRLGDARLTGLDLAVELDLASGTAAPRWPRERLLVARWTPERLEAYAARIQREGRSTTRVVRVPSELSGDAEIYIYQVGDEARRLGIARDAGRLRYVPWRSGVYWVLACGVEACFVIAATRHGA